jgi:hypothetical protein
MQNLLWDLSETPDQAEAAKALSVPNNRNNHASAM